MEYLTEEEGKEYLYGRIFQHLGPRFFDREYNKIVRRYVNRIQHFFEDIKLSESRSMDENIVISSLPNERIQSVELDYDEKGGYDYEEIFDGDRYPSMLNLEQLILFYLDGTDCEYSVNSEIVTVDNIPVLACTQRIVNSAIGVMLDIVMDVKDDHGKGVVTVNTYIQGDMERRTSSFEVDYESLSEYLELVHSELTCDGWIPVKTPFTNAEVEAWDVLRGCIMYMAGGM